MDNDDLSSLYVDFEAHVISGVPRGAEEAIRPGRHSGGRQKW